MSKVLTVGIGGFGAVGRKVAEALDKGAHGLRLAAISTYQARAART